MFKISSKTCDGLSGRVSEFISLLSMTLWTVYPSPVKFLKLLLQYQITHIITLSKHPHNYSGGTICIAYMASVSRVPEK